MLLGAPIVLTGSGDDIYHFLLIAWQIFRNTTLWQAVLVDPRLRVLKRLLPPMIVCVG